MSTWELKQGLWTQLMNAGLAQHDKVLGSVATVRWGGWLKYL